MNRKDNELESVVSYRISETKCFSKSVYSKRIQKINASKTLLIPKNTEKLNNTGKKGNKNNLINKSRHLLTRLGLC